MEQRESYMVGLPPQGLLCDKQIAELAYVNSMIKPYNAGKVRSLNGERVISYGQSSYGYDVTLSDEFMSYLGNTTLDPKNPRTLSVSRYTVESEYLDLPPNTAILARTNEYITMPDDITGIVLGKSTYARCGLFCNTTPLEAGWEGEVTLELRNLESHPIRLYINEGIAQILFFRGELPTHTYNGSYQGQRGVTLPFNPQ